MARLSRFLWALGALASHWRRRPTRLLATLVGLASATALWTGTQAVNEHARASYDRAAAGLGGPGVEVLTPVSGDAIDQSLFVALRRAGWTVSPAIDRRVRLSTPDGPERVRLLGIEPITAPPGAGVPGLGLGAGAATPDPSSNETPADALQAFLTPPGRAYAAPETVAALGGAGAALSMENGQALPPLFASDGLAPNLVIVDIGAAQRLLETPGRISRLLIDPRAPPGATPIDAIVGDALARSDAADALSQDLENLTDSFHLNLTAFGLLSFLVGLFIVHAAIGFAFEQRLGALRTLRACGVSARALTAALTLELVVIALVAGAIGVAGGYVIAGALLPDVAATLRGLYGAEVSGALNVRSGWWLSGLAMCVIGALIAAGRSLWRAWTLPALAPAQPTAWRRAHERWILWQAGLGVVLLLVAIATVWLFDGLPAGFVALAGLVLGAALILPAALDAMLSAGEAAARRAGGEPVAVWFWADGRQQSPGLSLALMALLLALAANIGVGTMVGSFRAAFIGWLDQRLASELYLQPSGAAADGVRDWLAQQPETLATLTVRSAETTYDGAPLGLVGYDDHATYRENWVFLDAAPDAWDRLAAGEAVLASEQLARRHGVWVGDRLALEGAAGAWTPEVVAVYADYGNPKAQASLSNAVLSRGWPDARLTSIGVRADPDDVGRLMEGYAEAFPSEASRAIDQAALKAYSVRVFERTFAVTAALNALTFGVAGVALLASLLTLSAMRLGQLAPLWAIGLTRARLSRLELAKTLALAAATAALAIPVGVALAWGLIAIVNVEAFGWRLPMRVFPEQWAWSAGLALATALAAAAVPTVRLRRTAPADLLRVFANER